MPDPERITELLLGPDLTLGGMLFGATEDGTIDLRSPTGWKLRHETERRAIWMIRFRAWCREGCPCPA